MADYDSYSDDAHLEASAAGTIQDGTNFSASIDMVANNARSLLFIAHLNAALTEANVAPTVEDSPDGSTWTAVAADLVLYRANDTVAKTVHSFGYIGKERYVRATTACTPGSTTAGITACLGHLTSNPRDQVAIAAS